MAPGDLDWGIDLDSATLIDGASAEPEIMAAIDGDYRRYYLGIRDAITDGGPNPVPPAEAVALMALIEAGVVAASTGSAQTLALTAAERTAFQAARGA
jgi:predicted dehydrogenase